MKKPTNTDIRQKNQKDFFTAQTCDYFYAPFLPICVVHLSALQKLL